MHSARVQLFDATAFARRMTRAEYDRLVEQGFFANERVELIRGMVVEMAPIGPPHSDAIDCLVLALVRGLGDVARIRVQNPSIAEDESEPQPDFAIVPLGDYSKEHPSQAYFMIEVADSSLKYDRSTKGPLYAESGIPEYWIVDVNKKAIEVYSSPVDGRYSEMRRIGVGGTVSPKAFPDFVLPMSAIFKT